MPQQPKKFEDLPAGQQAQIIQNLLPYPALTVMVFLRPDLGFRVVNPTWMFGTMMVEIIIAGIGQIFSTPNATSFKLSPLIVFALSSFAFGMVQRRKRWRELNSGVRQHSFYLGTSRLEFSWLPSLLLRHRRVERFVDPIFCFLLGTILLFYLPGLGIWLCISGVGLRVLEDDVYQKELNRNLDMVDSLIVSEIQGDVVEKFDTPASPAEPQPKSGVPTGLANDIHENLKRRKAKQPPPQKGV